MLLLRVRYLVHLPGQAPLFSEEVRVLGYTGDAARPAWLSEAEALRLLAEARPDANLSLERKKAILEATLKAYPTLDRTCGRQPRPAPPT